jgi:hypothetical protein
MSEYSRMQDGSGHVGHKQGSAKVGDYGTFLWAEREKAGFYRFQTDYQPSVDVMKKRGWDEKSPWRTIGWGTSYIFKRSFAGSCEAKRSISTILEKIGIQNVEFRKLESGGFEVLKAPNPILSHTNETKQRERCLSHSETPLMSGRNREPSSHVELDGGDQK